MTEVDVRQIQCPKCQTAYNLRPDFRGKVKCRTCKSTFSVGISQTQREGVRARNQSDARAAKKLMIVGFIALLAVAGLIAVASSSSVGDTKRKEYDPELEMRRRQQQQEREAARKRAEANQGTGGSNAGSSDPIPAGGSDVAPNEGSSWRNHPGTAGDHLLEALANEDKATFENLFSMDKYFEWAKIRWPKDDFDSTPEVRAHWEGLATEQLMDAERASVLKTLLVPQLGTTDTMAYRTVTLPSKESAELRYNLKDESGEDMLDLILKLGVREGGSYLSAGDWVVTQIMDRWYHPNLRNPKADKRPVDAGIGRFKRQEFRAMRAAAKGPPEAEPSPQGPVPGTDPQVVAKIESAISSFLDPGTSVRKLGEYREVIVGHGKASIPLLLNALMGFSHKAGDGQNTIFANMACEVLREITGRGFGYAPGMARGGLGTGSLGTATDEERLKAVRRWFGWWKTAGRTFTKKPDPEPEPEPEGGRRRGRRRGQ